MAMFALSLHEMGVAVGFVALPRGPWTCRAAEGSLDLVSKGFFRAAFDKDGTARLSSIVCFHWAMLPVALLLGRLRHVPVIYDEHDDYALNTLEGGGRPLFRRIVQLAIQNVNRHFVPRADLVTCIDQKDRHLERQLIVLNARVIPLANYPDSRWQFQSRPDSGPVHFVYAGGVFAEKGVLSALEAFKLLHIEMPGKLRLDIFGHGDPELIRKLAATPGVTVHGEVAGAVLRKFARDHRAVGLAMLANSIRYDRAGTNMTKLYEYLALGMPVIVSDTGDIGDFVRRTGTGLVVNTLTDVSQTKDVMHKLGSDTKLHETCVFAARELMKRDTMRWEHEWQKVIETGIFGEEAAGGF